jgi:hypothetical protein
MNLIFRISSEPTRSTYTDCGQGRDFAQPQNATTCVEMKTPSTSDGAFDFIRDGRLFAGTTAENVYAKYHYDRFTVIRDS